MEEMLSSAKKASFDIWGFSPHGPISIDSPCNMKKEDVAAYKNEILKLRRTFPEINILAGMEVDFIDEINGPASKEVRDYDLDYVIGSIHFIPNQKGYYHDIDGSPERFIKTLQDHFDSDLNYVIKTFWDQTQRMIKAGGFDIIGHIDKLALNASFIDPDIENHKEYSQLASQTIQLAIKSGKDIEINTKHWEKYGRFFPHPRYWAQILSAGINMPINSDTHYAEKVESGILEAKNIKDDILKTLIKDHNPL